MKPVLSVSPDELKDFEVAFDKDITINFVVSYDQLPEDEVLEPKTLRCRVMTKKNSMDEIIEVKTELTKYEDISFLLESNVTISAFNTIKETYGLLVGFDGFVEALCTFFDQTVTDSENVRVYLYDPDEETPSLTFYQNLRLRTVEVFSIIMERPSEDYMLRLAQCRFNAMNKELIEKTEELSAAINKLDARNPSLGGYIRSKIMEIE